VSFLTNALLGSRALVPAPMDPQAPGAPRSKAGRHLGAAAGRLRRGSRLRPRFAERWRDRVGGLDGFD